MNNVNRKDGHNLNKLDFKQMKSEHKMASNFILMY